LPAKYSPLNPANGRGLQSVYLAALPSELGALLAHLIAERGNPQHVADRDGMLIASFEVPERDNWESHELDLIRTLAVATTEREALIKARRGQGLFRQKVAQVERACRLKPWRHASNDERLSAHNGLMLAPHADFLFDRGFISFGDGRVLISPVADEKTLHKLGVDPDKPPEVGPFNRDQERFLEFHRDEIFRKAAS
jgi:hypothetical protein